MDDKCYFCNEYVPEGRMVCRGCEDDFIERSRVKSPRDFLVVKDAARQSIRVVFEDGEAHSLDEACAYGMAALKLHPDSHLVRIRFEGEEAVLECISYKPKFERLRRIAGYLSQVDRWNQGKTAELHDRVMHDADGSAAAGLLCEE